MALSPVSGRKVVLAVVLVAAAFAVLLLTKQFLGRGSGDACTSGVQCAGVGARCLPSPTGKYCTRRCAVDSECPGGWRCGATAWMRANGVVEKDERVCYRP